MLKKIIIYADGACRGNPGPGGYGAILIYNSHIKKIKGYCAITTNNRMELTAAIEALKSLKEPCQIDFYTDSQYVQLGISQWIKNWLVKNFKNVKNPDLWQELYSLAQNHQITWYWVRGHNGNPYNELADELANEAIDESLCK